MPSFDVYGVFTPTTQARLNFVARKEINDQLVDALRTPGKQLIIYGESGSGKSTLLLNKLLQTYPAHVTTQCSATTTYEELLLNAFDQLDQYYVEGKSVQRSRSVTPGVQADFLRIRAKIDASMSTTADRSETRVVPPQLTAQRLAQFLGEQQMCWVVEDFHKIRSEAKVPFAQSMKIFSDISATYSDVKTITIGATDTARQVVEYDPEMANRVSELLVPLMNDEEISSILTNGQELLNIDLSQLIDPIVEYSVGVPSVCHQLALNVCLEMQVMARQSRNLTLTPENLKSAIERYVRESSDTLKARFDRALRRHNVRKYDNCRLILTAMAAGPLPGLFANEILSNIRSDKPDYPAGNLTTYLKDLTQDSRGSTIRLGFDRRYRFVDPLYHTFAQATLLEREHVRSSAPSVAAIAADELARYWVDHDYDSAIGLKVAPGSEFDVWKTSFTANLMRKVKGSDTSPEARD